MKIALKRVYDPTSPADGCRVLVDRLWPRGMTRERAALDQWLKAIAPSTELRKAFHTAADGWDDFAQAYRKELTDPEHQEALQQLRQWVDAGPVTLLYSVANPEQNHAVLIRDTLVSGA